MNEKNVKKVEEIVGNASVDVDTSMDEEQPKKSSIRTDPIISLEY